MAPQKSRCRAAAGRALLGSTRNLLPPQALRAKLQANRAERYELLSSARALFLMEGKRVGLLYPQNFHRTAKCKWTPVSALVGVHASRKQGSAFYSGVMSCGSVWVCPVCAAKVQERRREEVAKALSWSDAEGLQAVMVTLTFPHYFFQSLSSLLRQQKVALKYLREGSSWARFKKTIGYCGLIRSLELTQGQNGWHPHTHELWFVNAGADADAVKKIVLDRWKISCARAGLLDMKNDEQVAAFEAHSVDVRGWCTASDYLAKQDDSRHWGVDAEIAKASTKAGRAKGKHPFALLSLFQRGDRKAGERYLEYAVAMKGKRQLFWSAGLKAKVGVEEKSDEEVAKEQRDAADLLGCLDTEQWKLIREAGLRAKVLDLAESGGGWEEIVRLLSELSKPPFVAALGTIDP